MKRTKKAINTDIKSKKTSNSSNKKKKVKVKDMDVSKMSLNYLRKTLPYKRLLFANEWMKNRHNQTAAYKKVYNKNASDNVAANGGNIILRDPKVKRYIELSQENFEEICMISKLTQLNEYAKIAYASIKDIKSGWYSLEEWETIEKENPDILDAVESVKYKKRKFLNEMQELEEVEYVEVKMCPKIPALQQIDQLMGYKKEDKLKVDLQLGTGNVQAIREAFGLDKVKNPLD